MNEERKPFLNSFMVFALHLVLVGVIMFSFVLCGATNNAAYGVAGILALFAFELLHYHAGKNGL